MSPLRLHRALLSRPRAWVLLLLWPLVVLLLIMAPANVLSVESTAVGAALTVVAASAVAALVSVALMARRFYRSVRAIRDKLFEGEYEMALDAARSNPALGIGLGFEKAFARMLEFDRRRADRVAAATRAIHSLLNEAPIPFFLADLEDDLIHLSRAARNLFEVKTDRFSLLALLLLPANHEFAHLYSTVSRGDRASAEATLTLHLPARGAARELAVRLVAVQDDEGMVMYILGFLSVPSAPAAMPADDRGEPVQL